MLFCNIFVFQLTVLLTLVRDHYYSVEYCDERVSFVCLSACLSVREHISRTTLPIFTIFVHVTAIAWYFSGGDEIRYVLPRYGCTCWAGIGDAKKAHTLSDPATGKKLGARNVIFTILCAGRWQAYLRRLTRLYCVYSCLSAEQSRIF